jgi:hypothetical protein
LDNETPNSRSLPAGLQQPGLATGAFVGTPALPLALLLAVAGQWLLMSRPAALLPGLLCYGVAGAVFAVAVRSAEPAPFRATRLPARPTGLGLWGTSLALNLFVVFNVSRSLPPAQNYLLAAAWLTSLALFSWSVLRAAGWHAGAAASRNRLARREWLAIGALMLIALAVRVWDLESHPYAFINDEGEVGKAAVSLLSGQRSDLFHTGWSAQPMWSFVPTALSVAIFGNSAIAVRLVSAVQGALSVVLLYGLAREAFGRSTAVLAALLLLGLAWHIHFSRLGVNNLIDSFLASGVLWLTYRALKHGGLPAYLWAGLGAGMTVYSYLGSRLVLALAAGLLAYVALRQRGYLRAHWRHLLVFALAAGLAAGPMLAFFARNPDMFMARLNAENIIANGWLASQASAPGGQVGALLEQFRRSSLVYVASPAPGNFFNSPRPYLAAPAAVFLVLGMGWALSRIGQPRAMLLLAWFWSVVVLGSTLTVGPPTSQRLIMSAPATALLAAIGLREAARLARQSGVLPARTANLLAVCLACLISLQGVAYYFGPYRSGRYFEDRGNELSYEAARQAARLDGPNQLWLLGHPRVYAVFANFTFLAPAVPVWDFEAPEPDKLAALPQGEGAFFVAVPERAAELLQVAEQLPGGEWFEVPRRSDATEVLYYAYWVGPSEQGIR